MPAAKTPPIAQIDKALARRLGTMRDQIDDVAEAVNSMNEASARAPLQKVVTDLRKRLQALALETDAKAAQKQVAVLGKDVDKAFDEGHRACIVDAMRGSWRSSRDRLNGLLAELMLEVGRIEPLALRAPLQKEQVALRAEMDRALQLKALEKALDAFSTLLDKCQALLPRVRAALETGATLRAGYVPMLARVRAQIGKVPADRCRKTLLAEVEFVEADLQKALAKGEAKSIKSQAIPQLQRLERLAARLTAVSPALDRELARIARHLQGRADAAPALRRLKGLVQSKAGAWPDGAGAEEIERALARFEADVAKLAAAVDKLPAATAPAGR